VTPGGTETTLYNFCSQPNCADGSGPSEQNGVLTLGASGDLYGTTQGQGTATPPTAGYGTIFRITPGGELSTLYTFCGPNCGDQRVPWAGVARGPDGNFYGVTDEGGNSNMLCIGSVDFPFSCGLAYKITPEGAFSVIYNFCSLENCADGSNPNTQLIVGIDGNLYGITQSGGTNSAGTVFKLTLGGKLTTLYSFTVSPCGNGNGVCAPLAQADNGNVYGMSAQGGTNGAGIFFELTPSGTFTPLYNFCSQANCADGANPAGFVLGSDGNFYGVANLAFFNLCGTLFKVTAKGALTTLYPFAGTFPGGPDGCQPAGLVQHTNGTFYGEATYGGANDGCPSVTCGTLFSLSAGLKPFVRTLELFGKVGSTVQILGDNLTSATAVSFDGTAAAFTVKSPTLITATVPTGATSGFVTVTTPTRTLKSNVRFRIR